MTNAVPGKVTALSQKKIFLTDSVILAQDVAIYQLFLICQQRRLTDALELLESIGITDDLALSVIANLQNLEVAA